MKARILLLRDRAFAMEPDLVRKISGYLFFFILATVIFMYMRFPADSLIPMVKKNLSGAPVDMDARGARLTFPPGIKLFDVRLTQPAKVSGDEILHIETLTIKPSYLSIITGGMGGKARAKTLGGQVYVYGAFDNGLDGNVELKFEADNIDPGLLAIWKEFKWMKLSGSLNGEGEISVIGRDIRKGAGNLKTYLNGGNITLAKALVGDGAGIVLDKGVLELTLDTGKIKIKRAVLTGPEIEASLTGDIILSATPRFSRLNLKVTLKISGGLKNRLGPFLSFFKKNKDGAVSIKIAGTVASPVTR